MAVFYRKEQPTEAGRTDRAKMHSAHIDGPVSDPPLRMARRLAATGTRIVSLERPGPDGAHLNPRTCSLTVSAATRSDSDDTAVWHFVEILVLT